MNVLQYALSCDGPQQRQDAQSLVFMDLYGFQATAAAIQPILGYAL